MEELTLASCLTVAGAAVVVNLIVQLVKDWVPDRFVRFVAVGVGIALVLVASVISHSTSPEQLFNGVLAGFLAGSSAIGFYGLQKSVRGN